MAVGARAIEMTMSQSNGFQGKKKEDVDNKDNLWYVRVKPLDVVVPERFEIFIIPKYLCRVFWIKIREREREKNPNLDFAIIHTQIRILFRSYACEFTECILFESFLCFY